MTLSLYVSGKTDRATNWLVENQEKIEATFDKVHEFGKDHPVHGMRMVPDPRGEEDPFLAIPCHWDSDHVEVTANDMREVLVKLGQKIGDFKFEGSG